MINLFIPYYEDSVSERRIEINACLVNNISNKLIGAIYLIIDDALLMSSLQKQIHPSNKVKLIFVHERPTYSTMFEVINGITSSEDWNILINSDIYLDETIRYIHDFSSDCFLALSRWDVDKQGNSVHFNRWDSQDTWAFKGKCKNIKADFFQGIAGCDNAIADRAEVAGYRVVNPSKTIKTYHLHNSGVRNYNPQNRVPKPYKLITPHE